jgi:hypothetical protein
MDEPDDLVYLGGLTVPAERLLPEADGIADPEVQGAIERVHLEPIGEPVPRSGWRVVAEGEGSVTVAAFDNETWHGWCTMTLRRGPGGWRPEGASYGQQPRPTAAARGRGFELRFAQPQFDCLQGEQPKISVRLINHSGLRFRDTTGWCAFGHLVDLGSGRALPTEEHLAIAAAGLDLDLGDGEGTTLPVVLATREPSALQTGVYGINASFRDLDLRAEGGRLRVG